MTQLSLSHSSHPIHSHPVELVDFWPCLRHPATLAQSCPLVTLCELHQLDPGGSGQRDSQTNAPRSALQQLPVNKLNVNSFYISKPVKSNYLCYTFYGKLANRCVFTIWSGVFLQWTCAWRCFYVLCSPHIASSEARWGRQRLYCISWKNSSDGLNLQCFAESLLTKDIYNSWRWLSVSIKSRLCSQIRHSGDNILLWMHWWQKSTQSQTCNKKNINIVSQDIC